MNNFFYHKNFINFKIKEKNGDLAQSPIPIYLKKIKIYLK